MSVGNHNVDPHFPVTMTAIAENEQAKALDGALADLLDLALLAKQAHWNLVGPRFRSMQLLLDELADTARESANGVAERAVTLGHSADGRAATVTALSSLPRLEPGALRDVDAIKAFGSILEAIENRMHSALEAFERDPVTVDLFTGILAAIEKYAWMLRAQGC
jgi:starvation-inducible DNA-binding protein